MSTANGSRLNAFKSTSSSGTQKTTHSIHSTNAIKVYVKCNFESHLMSSSRGFVLEWMLPFPRACDSRGRRFNSWLLHCKVTTLNKLFTHVSVTKQYKLVPVEGQQCPAARKVIVGLASQWSCVTDLSGLSTYRLNAQVRLDEH